MFNEKRILALIPARGGSKGIPGKNIRILGGKPLLAWTIEAAQNSKYLDRIILSSDSEEIISVAKEYGCEVPFVRPADLARDETSSMDVIIHALDMLDESYDYLLLLQPTSPFRTTHDIDAAIEHAFSVGAKMLVSVARLKKHPMFMYRVVDGFLESIIDSCSPTQLRRQDMPPAFEHNGAIYFAEVSYLRSCKSFNGQKVFPYLMEGRANLDIDTIEDWIYAEFLASQRGGGD